jgi:cytochrome P450
MAGYDNRRAPMTGPAIEYDPLAPAVLADQTPTFRWLVDRCPVHHHVLPPAERAKIEGNPLVARPTTDLYTLARHEDVLTAAHDNAGYPSGQGPGPERTEMPEGVGVLVYADEPEHRAQRRIVNKTLTPRAVRAIEPRIAEVARELIAEFAGDGQVDLVPAYCDALPVRIFYDILGVPVERRADFKRWVDDTIAAFGGNAESYRRSKVAFEELTGYFMAEIAGRRNAIESGGRVPDDLPTALITNEHDGWRFSDLQIVFAVHTFLVGGQDTTSSALANAVHLLCTHPGERAKIERNPDLLPRAIEEVLRFESPIQGMFRTTAGPVEVAGVPIPADAKVRLLYAAANRDPARWSDPDVFRVDRDESELRHHLGFGAGIHSCVGAALARAELKIGLRTLLDRLPALRLDGDRPGERGNAAFFVRAWRHLHVRWDDPTNR